MTKVVTSDKFLLDVNLRNEYLDRTDVLHKVKDLLLIPIIECMTSKQVADFYEVPIETIRTAYKSHKEELVSDGVMKCTIEDVKGLIGWDSTYQNVNSCRGGIEISINDTTKVFIPNTGVIIYPKRAILRMGMLLRDSPIAKEIRTQLLNITEHAQEEMPEVITKEIDTEQALYLDIGKAFATGDIMQFAQVTQKLTEYQNRHITKLKAENEKINAEKEVLAADILKWTDRASANRLIRVLNGKLRQNFGETYGLVYKELLYKFHINLKLRGDKPYISHLKDNE